MVHRIPRVRVDRHRPVRQITRRGRPGELLVAQSRYLRMHDRLELRTGVGITEDDLAQCGPVDGGFDILEAALDRARAGLAAEMLGTATQAFEITLDYLKTRTQFGQPLANFQALQHSVLQMMLR